MRTKQKIDQLGRIVIGNAMREEMGWKPGDELIISSSGKYVMIQRPYDVCLVCGTTRTNLLPIGDRYVCRSCAEKALQKGQ